MNDKIPPSKIMQIMTNPEYTTNEKKFFIMCAALYLLGPEEYEKWVRRVNNNLPPAPEEV